LLYLLQKFSFQDIENSRIKIAVDRTVPNPEDPYHEDKMPKNTRAASAAGKASSSRHSIQDWSDDDSDEEILIYYDPIPLAYAFPTIPLMSTHASVLVDSVGPPSAEVCRVAASIP
jgi:hypothetical protein